MGSGQINKTAAAVTTAFVVILLTGCWWLLREPRWPLVFAYLIAVCMVLGVLFTKENRQTLFRKH